jgi:hypothetical protein
VKSSVTTKRDFREQVLRAAEEYRQENRLELDISRTEEVEETSSGEISNPNEELPVTYLFYELQRRYEIRERLYELTPVVLVANEVPAPHKIDESWLIRHAWIIRRVILDADFLPALDAVTTDLVGAEFALEILRGNLERQKGIVDELKQQVVLKTKQTRANFEDLEEALEKQEHATRRESSEGLFESVGEALFGGGGRDDSEGGRLRAERARMAFEQVEAERRELLSRLSAEVSALEAAVQRYSTALQEHLNRRAQMARLRLHIRDNILYYMQAIWNHEPPDQRLLRLYKIKTFWVTAPEDYQARMLEDGVEIELPEHPHIELDKPLAEIANLDRLLGYFGNYMVFPMTQSNLITSYMMADHIKGQVLVDPDEYGNYTNDELLEHVRCLYQKDPDAFSPDEIDRWTKVLEERLTNPRRDKEEVVVPTNSLYIEALPGTHPILENFKLAHRILDVQKVRADVRATELENLRAAARLVAGERDDPNVDRTIVISGETPAVMVTPDV